MHNWRDTQSMSSLQHKSQGCTVPDTDVHVTALTFSPFSLQAAHSGHDSTYTNANAQPSSYRKTRRNVRHSTVYTTSALCSIVRCEEEGHCGMRNCIRLILKKKNVTGATKIRKLRWVVTCSAREGSIAYVIGSEDLNGRDRCADLGVYGMTLKLVLNKDSGLSSDLIWLQDTVHLWTLVTSGIKL